MKRVISPIFKIDQSHQEDAVKVLCAGFRDYPVMQFFFGTEGERFEISVSARLQMSWAVLGCVSHHTEVHKCRPLKGKARFS